VSALPANGADKTVHNVKAKEPHENKKGFWEMHAQVLTPQGITPCRGQRSQAASHWCAESMVESQMIRYHPAGHDKDDQKRAQPAL
jgi:hypothetical protein